MRFLKYLLLLLFITSYAQEDEVIQSIYFDFDKFDLRSDQQKELHKFIKTVDTSRVESIQISGYCDDRGKDAYNYDLSTKRANTIKDSLLLNGIKNKIIVSIQGKGSIMIDEDLESNIPEVRSKNRRVDVVVNFKPPIVKRTKPENYTVLRKDVIVGDKITLDKVFFDRGSSRLGTSAKKELDKIAIKMHRFPKIELEVQGHICCTPSYQKEASIGRVVVSEKVRAKKWGHDLMKVSIEAIEKEYKTSQITISAQEYLKKFYETHQFEQTSEMYLEDDIPHIQMKRK